MSFEPVTDTPLHLRAGGVSVVLHTPGGGLPRILHWGSDLGELTDTHLGDLVSAGVRGTGPSEIDEVVGAAVVPEHASGWSGRPGLVGHRDGQGWSPQFTVTGLHRQATSDGGERVVTDAADRTAGLGLQLEMELLPSGLLRGRATLSVRPDETSDQPGALRAGENGELAPYHLESLALAMPVPAVATELFDLTGRWGRERSPQRTEFLVGTHLRDNRRGRTGADTPLILAAGRAGFGFESGEVWAIHVAFSGNHRAYAERLATGLSVLGGGELLLPGELRLTAGQTYETPWIYASHGFGLDEVAGRFHRYLRSRPHHPRLPRPVIINTWEAVVFDHDLKRLTELAKRGAAVGAERYVLDDGWFRHRRHDRAGLGDWYVDEDVWPDGLTPLIDVVRGLGMEFGLWVEPEMINPDSDLARAHPEWILATGGRMPPPSRHQQVLDLGHEGAYAYILERLDALLTEYDISYLKWDHNRDLVDAGHSPGGEAGVHEQTLATYRLIDELKARHPGVEIESCSSGGLRVDLGILERTDRVWGSDVIDALERQRIQRWTTQVLAPELIGSHVGDRPDHSTGRCHDLAFRAGTALFCSFGIEWDLTRCSDGELAELARWVALYKETRQLLHTGRVVRADQHDPSLAVHGVVAQDGSDALFAVVALTTAVTTHLGAVRLPGLDPDTTYRLRAQEPGDRPVTMNHRPVEWLEEGVTLTGRVLGSVGVQVPILKPEQLLLLRAEAMPTRHFGTRPASRLSTSP